MSDFQLKKNKEFGIVIGLVLLMFTAFKYFKGNNVNLYATVTALLLLLIALTTPILLTPFEKLWRKIGIILGIINSYIILFFIYLILFIPIGIILKLLNKDPLKKSLDKGLKSYWDNKVENTNPDKMKYQF